MTDDTPPVLAAEGLTVAFGRGSGRHAVLRSIDLDVPPGQALGLVGESGSGKSTLARALVGLVRPAAGRVLHDGRDPAHMRRAELAELRRSVQLIPQDPYASLDPRMTVGAAIAEAVDPRRADPRRHADRIAYWLETVALERDAADRHPHAFSGGQRQRVAIARALAARPRAVIADEITSALDCSVQAEILNVLADLRARLGLTMLFISHDLTVVRHVSDRVAVLYLGRVVEQGETETLYSAPAHPYTRLLLDSVPDGGPLPEAREAAAAEAPDPRDPPRGCAFHPRCTAPGRREDVCAVAAPEPDGPTAARCHFPLVGAHAGS
ncbi:oligopeptide/dipeptide ABC transporter ATP-binding protein [Streptomonospora litoralis]|uniref:Oligopeptide transport ATP-binding protein OppF n=1 Tax=Streptomonospora litoralis TaxID=2498135 RepID=A0A4P6Q7C0_9ACTN|nr:ABC transporter ATP-binding protein [Streptomonospora litoralis]QBI56686.1 Oligopeptide transport ATP-binding protein OppF [Streptomonospora litoralis]